jgi:hypothetical protein
VIANKMADAVGVRFESQASHFRFSTDKEIDIAPLREALDVDIKYIRAILKERSNLKCKISNTGKVT